MKKIMVCALVALLAVVGLFIGQDAEAAAGDVTPANASWLVLPSMAVSVADGAVVTNVQTFVKLSANGAAASNDVTFAAAATDGAVVIVANVGTNLIHFADSGNVKLSAVFTMGQYDTLTLIGDSTTTTWIETARSNN